MVKGTYAAVLAICPNSPEPPPDAAAGGAAVAVAGG